MEHVLRHLGRERRFAIDGSDLVITSDHGTRRVALASIRSVRVTRLGSMEMCVLATERGEETIVTDERDGRPVFAELVRALYTALSSRGVPFVAGSWLVASIVAASSVVLGVIGAALWLQVIDAPAFHVRGVLLALACAVLGPFGVWSARPRALPSETALIAILPR